MRFVTVTFLLMILLVGSAYAQQDSSDASRNDNGGFAESSYNRQPVLDSVAEAIKARQDFVSDSLAKLYISPADPSRHSQLVDSLLSKYAYKGNNFLDLPASSTSSLREGHQRHTRDQWVIVMIIGLLFYTGILNRGMSKDFESVWQSFYSKRMLTQVSREDGLINSWTFIALFLLFCLTFGLFLYQLAQYYHVYYSTGGVRLFLTLSLDILILFAIKFLVVKFLGFVFNINKLVSEYLSVLYLTYFNIAFVFLPVTVCFCLLTDQLIPYILGIALVLVVIIFIWQYLRSSVTMVSNVSFHKFYLFVYLCALEICPILILIKALNI
jgi:hypothetical protein